MFAVGWNSDELASNDRRSGLLASEEVSEMERGRTIFCPGGLVFLHQAEPGALACRWPGGTSKRVLTPRGWLKEEPEERLLQEMESLMF